MVVDVSATRRVYISSSALKERIISGGKFMGQGRVMDYVYGSANPDRELMFVRKVSHSLWPSMDNGKFYPFLKTGIEWVEKFETATITVGKPLVECTCLPEAAAILGYEQEPLFSFQRFIAQYQWRDLMLYLEEIDHLPLTMEIISNNPKLSQEKNKEAVNAFLAELNSPYSIQHQMATLVKRELGK